MSKFTVSYSGLQQFMSGCYAKYTFYQKWELVKKSPALAFGILVHKLVEDHLSTGKLPNPGDDYNPVAYDTADRIMRMVQNLDYQILGQEVLQVAPLTDDIQVVRKIDAVALKDDMPVNLDWKTGAAWQKTRTEEGEVVYPKAQTFQGPMYCLPPYENDFFPDGAWPAEVHYLMAPKDNVTKVYEYHYTEKDRQRTIMACKLMKEAHDRGWFPKNKGHMCRKCDFYHVCWKTKGWQKHYVKREKAT